MKKKEFRTFIDFIRGNPISSLLKAVVLQAYFDIFSLIQNRKASFSGEDRLAVIYRLKSIIRNYKSAIDFFNMLPDEKQSKQFFLKIKDRLFENPYFVICFNCNIFFVCKGDVNCCLKCNEDKNVYMINDTTTRRLWKK